MAFTLQVDNQKMLLGRQMAQDSILLQACRPWNSFLLWSFGCKENASNKSDNIRLWLLKSSQAFAGKIFGAGSMEPSVIYQQISDIFHDINEYRQLGGQGPSIPHRLQCKVITVITKNVASTKQNKPPKITNILAIKVAGCFSSFFTNLLSTFFTQPFWREGCTSGFL